MAKSENIIDLDRSSQEVQCIGLCADLHGNLTNLRKMFRAASKVKHWFCAGDLVDTGKKVHDNYSFLRYAASLDCFHAVRGNHDVEYPEKCQGQLKKMREDHRKALADYLIDLPDSLTIHFGGRKIWMRHTSPGQDGQWFPDFPKTLEGQELDAQLRNRFADIEADVIVFGHNHDRPICRKVDGKVFINPGYSGERGQFSYCLLDRDGSVTFSPERLGEKT